MPPVSTGVQSLTNRENACGCCRPKRPEGSGLLRRPLTGPECRMRGPGSARAPAEGLVSADRRAARAWRLLSGNPSAAGDHEGDTGSGMTKHLDQTVDAESVDLAAHQVADPG